MQDLLLAVICFCGAGVAFALGLLMLRRRRAARLSAQERAAIAECARADQVVAEQLQFLHYIHRRWPEAIRVSLDSRQRFTATVEALVRGGPVTWEMLEAYYRERPGSVHVTLNSRQHKMQICDAQRLGVAVTVQAEAGRTVRPNPREEEAGMKEASRRQESKGRLGRFGMQ
jgi:hypothetical protein